MVRFVVPLAVMLAAVTSVAHAAAATPHAIAAFCTAHPDLDFPKRGAVPPEVAAVAATNWRCMDGVVQVCAGGASGSACGKMAPGPKPSKAIRETCADDPGARFVAIAVIGNSSSTWRCEGATPTIIKTVPLDRRGFMTATWAPLFDASGNVRTDIELGADPR